MTEDPGTGQPVVPVAAPANPLPITPSCLTCGSVTPADQPPTAFTHSHARLTAIGTVNAEFGSISVEKKFAQLLGHRDFKGFTDRQTMHSILTQPQNHFLAWQMCYTITPYGAGPSPAYVLRPQHEADLSTLVDTLRRSPSASEFDVVKGTIHGYAPPDMCNGQQIPIVAFSELFSFQLDEFTGAIHRPDSIPEERFKAAVDEVFHRVLPEASNATGPTLGLAFALLHYEGFFRLVAEKFNENSSLTRIAVNQSPSNPDRADIRLRFVERDTGFTETYSFAVNYAGPFDYLEELLHPSIDVSIS